MTKSPSLILWPAAALLLAGCTTDDPDKGGLFGGLIGIGSGAYEERVADQTAALKTEEIRYKSEVDGNRELDRALRERRSQASDLQRQLASLRQQVDGLDVEIEALRREGTVTGDEVEKAESNVASILDEIDRIESEQVVHEKAKALGADGDPDTDPAEFGEPPSEQVSDLRAYIIELQEAVDALKSARERHAGEADATSAD